MIFLQAPPHPALRNYIHQYWYLSTENALEFGNLKQMMFPIDFSGLSFYFSKQPVIEHYKNKIRKQVSVLYTGLITSPGSITFEPNEPIQGFVVAFYPHGFSDLFQFDVSTVTDKLPDFYSLFETDGKMLYENMSKTIDFETQKQIADEYFLPKISSNNHDPLPMIEAITKIVNSNGLIDMEQLAKEVNMSWKTLERHFKTRVGVPPKMYARFKRFHYALALLNEPAPKSLLEIAHICGYYDQAHFIREFNQFSGQNPSAFSVADYPLFYSFIIKKS